MFSSYRDRRTATLGCMSIGLVVSGPATAQVVPRISVDTAVLLSDNPFLLTGVDRQSAQFDVTASPGVTWTTQTGSVVDLGAVVTRRVYSRRYPSLWIGRVDLSATYRDSAMLSFGGSAYVARDSAIDLLTSSVEAAADPSGIRTTTYARVFAQYRPDGYSLIVPDLRFERSNYGRSVLLGDTQTRAAGLSYTRRVSARRTLGVRAGWVSNQVARLPSFDTQVVYVTIDQRLSAGWRINGELGAERNGGRVETLGGATLRRPARTLPGVRVNLCRTAPDPAICIGGSLVSEVSGLGGVQRRTVVDTTVSQRLGERTTLRVSAEYQRTRTQEALFPPFDAIRAIAAVDRRLSRRIVATGTAQYLRRRLVDGDRVGAAYFGLRLTYTPEIR